MNKSILKTSFSLLTLSIAAGLFSASLLLAQPGGPRNLLAHALKGKTPGAYFQNMELWRKTQLVSLTQQIRALPDSVKGRLKKEGSAALAFSWPPLTASLYLDYKKTGNRANFETRQTERRTVLSRLVIGYLLSEDKKYLPQIINGLYAVLEESSWVLPAHLTLQKSGPGLPDPGDPVIDLGCGMTAPLIASVQFLLRRQLDERSPNINKRIDQELRQRIYAPYLQRTDYWWMGLRKQTVNNWNPWINANILYTALLNEQDADTLNSLAQKIIRSTDIFINQYPSDGGCDEGTTYWSHAGGMLVYLLQMLHSASGGQIGFQGDSLLHNMGTYIYKMQIAGDYFVNSGDGAPRTIPQPAKVWLYGNLLGDTTLQSFASYLFTLQNKSIGADNLEDFLMTVPLFNNLATTKPVSPLPAVSWLPELQVLTARSESGSAKGLFFSAKAGNNGESHNHNDVGNFVLYAAGNPVIIDAGIGTYNSQTFSSRRYELWQMQSGWHNCPLVNGYDQKDGKKYSAKDVAFSQKKGQLMLSMELGPAYPPEADVSSWKRTFNFFPQKGRLSLTDQFLLQKVRGESKIYLLTPCALKQNGDDHVTFYKDSTYTAPLLDLHTQGYKIEVENKAVTDDRLRNSWGSHLYRVILSFNRPAKNGLSAKGQLDFMEPAVIKK